jgi:hypothetical protein
MRIIACAFLTTSSGTTPLKDSCIAVLNILANSGTWLKISSFAPGCSI